MWAWINTCGHGSGIIMVKRPIGSFAGKPCMILVLLRHTSNPSSKFIDLDKRGDGVKVILHYFDSVRPSKHL